MEEVLHIRFLVKEHDVGCKSATADAKVDIFVVGNGSIVFLIEVLKELVATFRAFPSAGNGEVVDKEAKYAVIVVGGLVEKAARICW